MRERERERKQQLGSERQSGSSSIDLCLWRASIFAIKRCINFFSFLPLLPLVLPMKQATREWLPLANSSSWLDNSVFGQQSQQAATRDDSDRVKVTLSVCLAYFFTCCLNNRLNKWLREADNDDEMRPPVASHLFAWCKLSIFIFLSSSQASFEPRSVHLLLSRSLHELTKPKLILKSNPNSNPKLEAAKRSV